VRSAPSLLVGVLDSHGGDRRSWHVASRQAATDLVVEPVQASHVVIIDIPGARDLDRHRLPISALDDDVDLATAVSIDGQL